MIWLLLALRAKSEKNTCKLCGHFVFFVSVPTRSGLTSIHCPVLHLFHQQGVTSFCRVDFPQCSSSLSIGTRGRSSVWVLKYPPFLPTSKPGLNPMCCRCSCTFSFLAFRLRSALHEYVLIQNSGDSHLSVVTLCGLPSKWGVSLSESQQTLPRLWLELFSELRESSIWRIFPSWCGILNFCMS